MSWIASGVIVGAGMLSSVMTTGAAGKSAQAQAKSVGIKNAQTKASSARIRASAPSEFTALHTDELHAQQDIELAQEAAEAQVKVQAAAAGVTGASVDSVVQETQANAGRALGAIDQQTEQAYTSLRQQAIDLTLETDAKTIRPQYKSGRGLQQLGLSTIQSIGTIAGTGAFGSSDDAGSEG
jgi:hypothetical protein